MTEFLSEYDIYDGNFELENPVPGSYEIYVHKIRSSALTPDRFPLEDFGQRGSAASDVLLQSLAIPMVSPPIPLAWESCRAASLSYWWPSCDFSRALRRRRRRSGGGSGSSSAPLRRSRSNEELLPASGRRALFRRWLSRQQQVRRDRQRYNDLLEVDPWRHPYQQQREAALARRWPRDGSERLCAPAQRSPVPELFACGLTRSARPTRVFDALRDDAPNGGSGKVPEMAELLARAAALSPPPEALLEALLLSLAAGRALLLRFDPSRVSERGVGFPLALWLSSALGVPCHRHVCGSDVLPPRRLPRLLVVERLERASPQELALWLDVAASGRGRLGARECVGHRRQLLVAVSANAPPLRVRRVFFCAARVETPLARGGSVAARRLLSPGEWARLRDRADRVDVNPETEMMLMDLIVALRYRRQEALEGPEAGAERALARAARVVAALWGQEFATPTQVAAIAKQVLAHRIEVPPNLDAEEVVESMLGKIRITK